MEMSIPPGAPTMTLYHVTSKVNMASIDATGLDPSKATHGEKAVWLVSRSNISWALGHTAAKPGRGAIGELVVYRCEVSRRSLRRFRRGIWRSYSTVRPVAVTGSSEYTDNYPS
jgi:hypothetical protein